MARRISLAVIILSISIGSGHLMELRAAQEHAEKVAQISEADNS